MGCDIHAWIEWDEFGPEHEKWAYAEVDLGRNYLLFSLMANVRQRNENPVGPVAYPKGIPERTSSQVLHEYRDVDGDAHSASWLDVDELATVLLRWETYTETTQHQLLRATIAAMRELPGARLVFWFDN